MSHVYFMDGKNVSIVLIKLKKTKRGDVYLATCAGRAVARVRHQPDVRPEDLRPSTAAVYPSNPLPLASRLHKCSQALCALITQPFDGLRLRPISLTARRALT